MIRISVRVSILLFLFAASSTWAADESVKPAAVEAKPSIESRYSANIRQVTSGLSKAGEGYFSPEAGDYLSGRLRSLPFYQIYTQSSAGEQTAAVSTSRGKTTCSFSDPTARELSMPPSHLDPDLDRTEGRA